MLDPVMIEHGFQFVPGSSGNSSGGSFASGYYQKGNRRFSFSVRYNLGCVTYYIEEDEIEHSKYMRVVGVEGEYPGFSQEPAEAFRHLANDVKNSLSTFLKGSDLEFRQIVQSAKANPKKKGYGALP